MKLSLIFITLALSIGVVIGVIIHNDSETIVLTPTTPTSNTTIVSSGRNTAKNPDADRVAVDVIELNRLLQNEIRARRALEQKFEALSRQMANLDISRQSFMAARDSEQKTNNGESDVPDPDNDWFNEQALIVSGMASSQASELKIIFEQLEMERLYLRDQSIREGWDNEKYREEMQTLAGKEDDLKNQLSESEYDAYLYASGQTNRVLVTSVLASAQAGIAGILSGDHIVRYDNQRIYSGNDLHEATTAGSIDDTVSLEVERDGETMQFYLPRGPLGIRMNSMSVAP